MAKAAVAVPVEPIYTLPRFKSLTSVQLVPFHDSVIANPSGEGLGVPPNATADVLSAPAPDKPFLPVFKLFTSVQFVPFQVSVLVLATLPGNAPP
jgi:hypothetical protein